MRCAAVLIKLPRITILPYLLSHMKACSKRQTYPRIKGVRGDGCHSVSVKRVPSRFMRKIVCRLRLNEVNRQ